MIEQLQQTRERQDVRFPYFERKRYRDGCTRTKEEQAQLLEVLRYRTYSPWSLSQRIMQRLGDFGRDYLPFLMKWRSF